MSSSLKFGLEIPTPLPVVFFPSMLRDFLPSASDSYTTSFMLAIRIELAHVLLILRPTISASSSITKFWGTITAMLITIITMIRPDIRQNISMPALRRTTMI